MWLTTYIAKRLLLPVPAAWLRSMPRSIWINNPCQRMPRIRHTLTY
jgi:hypothetical protein